MHILIATPAFPPFIGGGERHTGTLAQNLIDRGQEVTVLTSSAVKETDFWQGCALGVGVETPQPGFKVIRVPIMPIPGGYRGLLAWRKGMVLLSTLPGTLHLLQTMAKRVPALDKIEEAMDLIEKSVDVVHGFNISWEYAMMTGWQFARKEKLPFIASPLAHLGTGPKDRVAKNSTMRHQRFMLSTADLLITNTAIEAQGLMDRGVTQVPFKVAGPGVDIPKKVAALPESGGALKPYVLFIGRTSYDKGAQHAAEAVLRLRDQGSIINLVLIGRETDSFRRFYNKLTTADRKYIHFLGFVEESLKHAYLRDAEALLLPSRTDSFGIVLLESWLYNRPVIAADAGGLPAVVDEGVNGLLVPFGDVSALADAIKQLTENQRLNKEMGVDGRQKLMAHYTWEAVTDKVLDAYRMVAAAQKTMTKIS